MGDVLLHHPDLPEQPISVPEQAVAHHRAAGWVPADKPPSARTTADDDAASEPAPDTAPRRRAIKEVEQ